MPSKQFKPGRPRAVSPNLTDQDMHLAAFAGLDSAGKHITRRESKFSKDVSGAQAIVTSYLPFVGYCCCLDQLRMGMTVAAF
jgi:hypothetical protein